MEDIENYSIFGLNIGGKSIQQETGSMDLSVLSGIFGGAILGLSISQIFNAANDVNFLNQVQKAVSEFDAKRSLRERLNLIRQKIQSGNDIEIYGGILILFSELEKFVDTLYTKYVSSNYKPDTFREKVTGLEQQRTISGVEANILRNEIYPKRNLISHGKYNNVNQKDVLACYDFISQFIDKYYMSV